MKRKKNQGFTLIELIVVIVIISILIGVAIKGIWGYVTKARISQDIATAEAIEKTLAPLATNSLLSKYGLDCNKDIKGLLSGISWNSSCEIVKSKMLSYKNSRGTMSSIRYGYYRGYGYYTDGWCFEEYNSALDELFAELNRLLPDGLPNSKYKHTQFFIIVSSRIDGTIDVHCNAYTDYKISEPTKYLPLELLLY